MPEMRLIDELLHDPKVFKDSPEIKPGFESATVVAADNVAEYYFDGTDQEVWDDTKDFPNVAPPWPVAFVEARPPRWLRGDNGRHPFSVIKGGLESFGALVVALPLGKWMATEKTASALQTIMAGLEARDPRYAEVLAPLWRSGAEWMMSMVPAVRMNGRVVTGLYSLTYAIDKKGQCLTMQGSSLDGTKGAGTHVVQQLPGGQKLTPDEVNLLRRELSFIPNIVMLAYSFSHCKNATVREVRTPARLAKRTLERHGISPRTYSMIEIDAMRKVLRAEGRSGEVGGRRALHFCRGHFKTYTERGLFGKHFGTFFVAMHARGNPEDGEVVSQYRVRASQ
jgi:hypothetical protein